MSQSFRNLLFIGLGLMVVLLLSYFTLPLPSQPEEQTEALGRWDLYRSMSNHGQILLIHNTREKEQLALLKKLAEGMSYQRRTRLEVYLIHESKITADQIAQNPIFIVSTSEQSELIKKMAREWPVDFKKSSFTFDDKTYESARAVFRFSLIPNPANRSFPLYLVAGNTEEGLYNYLEKMLEEDSRALYRSRWSYEVAQESQQLVFGMLNEATWEFDKKTHFDFNSGSAQKLESQHFTFISHCPKWTSSRLRELSDSCESTLHSIGVFLQMPTATIDITYNIFPGVENKALRLNNSDQAQCDFQYQQVFVVANEKFSGHLKQAENQLILRQLLGAPNYKAFEKGLSLNFTTLWHQKGYLYWAKRLAQSDNLPPVIEILDNELLDKASDLVMDCASGALVHFLLDYWGKEEFLARYTEWQASEAEFTQLDLAFKKYMEQLPDIQPVLLKKCLPYLKGFNFAHEGYSIYNGYGSALASNSLKRIASIKGNAVAIVPYSYMDNPNKPSFIPITQSAGSENDQSVIFAGKEAQKLGMIAMLKPQIWFGRGSWPGDVYMNSEKDWQLFFDYYYRWMRHYALVAEMYGFDALCVGVEFARATLEREQDYRNLIRKLRGIYSGPMTYAANWGEEFEKLNFWDELDFIGIDCYYPLSNNKTASKKDLDQNFKTVLQKIEGVSTAYNKPVIFTEIGFRSVDHTWIQPHESANNRPVNLEAQRMCYEIVLKNIKNKKWCQGLLWWKWPSHMNNSDGANTRFTPFNKPAEKIVETYFEDLN